MAATWATGLLALHAYVLPPLAHSLPPRFRSVANEVANSGPEPQGPRFRADSMGGGGRAELPENFHPHVGTIRFHGEMEDGLWITTSSPIYHMLQGTSNITHLYGDIVVDGTNRLQTLGAFSRLAYVDGSIQITGNHALQSHGGFPKLRRVTGEIVFSDNAALRRISTRQLGPRDRPNPRWALFPALRDVGGGVSVLRNPQLSHAPQMPSLERCTGGIEISDNEKIEIFSSFPRLIEVAGPLKIRSNSRLTEIDAFGLLKRVGGHLEVSEHNRLNHLEAFGRLVEIGGNFTVVRNRDFIKPGWLEAFRSLTEVGGSVLVSSNGYEDSLGSSELKNVDGLRALRRVGGSLVILKIEQSGEWRSQTAGLCGLQSVGGDIHVGVYYVRRRPPECRGQWLDDFSSASRVYRGHTRRELWRAFKIWLAAQSCRRTCEIEAAAPTLPAMQGPLPTTQGSLPTTQGPTEKQGQRCGKYDGDKLRCILSSGQLCKYLEGRCIYAA